MGLDLWFREDVARILASTHETMRAAAEALRTEVIEMDDAYRRGFEDGLRTVAVAFGVTPPGPRRPKRSGPQVRIVDGESTTLGATRWEPGRWNGNGDR